MSLPATWFPMQDVGTTGNQRPHPATCADPQVGGLLWRGQPAHGTVRTHDVRGLQRRDLPQLPQAHAASSTPPRASHGPRTRQRSLSSRRTPRPLSASARTKLAAAVSAALQPAARPYRESLETDPAARHAQPLLRHAPGSAPGCRCLLRSLASSESGATTTMLLHYLRRCV